LARTLGLVGLGALALGACGPKAVEENRRSNAQGAIGLNDKCTTEAQSLLLADGEDGELDAVATSMWAEARTRLAPTLPSGITIARGTVEVVGDAAHLDLYPETVASGIRLCGDAPVKAHAIGEQLLVDRSRDADALMKLSRVDPSRWQWQPAAALVAAAAKTLGSDEAASLVDAKRCFVVRDGAAAPAWDARAWIDGAPYRILGNGDVVHDVEREGFHASGSARVYDTGPKDGQLVDVAFTDLAEGTERLQTNRFSIVNDDDSDAAVSATRAYAFDPNDSRFVETSLFAHAEQMAAFYLENGGLINHCLPIVLHAHAMVKDQRGVLTPNNAQYVPAIYNENGLPRIDVGDGDGKDLDNLGKDFDVVAHELGHHVIYRKLTSQKDESAVIHEGLADALVFARTGNACLGESICPPGGGCWLDGECLRTADNELKLTDEDLPPYPHLRSQFLSGMLWDLGKSIGHDVVAKTILGSIDYLQAKSGYTDLIKGLMAADKQLHAGANACAIYDAALARGLADAIAGLQCDDYK
jgi:hypothetical protein